MLVFHIALDGHQPPTLGSPANNFHLVALVGEKNFQVVFFQRFCEKYFWNIFRSTRTSCTTFDPVRPSARKTWTTYRHIAWIIRRGIKFYLMAPWNSLDVPIDHHWPLSLGPPEVPLFTSRTTSFTFTLYISIWYTTAFLRPVNVHKKRCINSLQNSPNWTK